MQNGTAVYLDEVEVGAQDFQQACPTQTQIYTLRVLYPGGERTAQVTLEVTDALVPPTDTPTPVVCPTNTPILATTPTPEAIAAASDRGGHDSPPNTERRFTVTGQERSNESENVRQIILYGGGLLVLLLFLAIPLVLLLVGSVIWWLRRPT